MDNPTSPLNCNQCLFPFAQSLRSYNLRKPRQLIQEYVRAPLATCIPSSITQLSFGSLFHTHCSRYPIMLNSAKPYLITGKNTSTNLSSICNTHPPPPPASTNVRFFLCSLLLETPAIRASNPVGDSTNINNTNTLNGTCAHALRHGIQISMEAILACHPPRSTE